MTESSRQGWAEGHDDGCALNTDADRRLQRGAPIWFFGAVMLGSMLTYTFSRIDRRMYDSKAETVDIKTLRANREALVQSEVIDPRQRGGLSAARAETTSDRPSE